MTKCAFATAAELANLTGLSARYFQKLAASGKIDWAFQPTGEGGPWRFELAGFEAWWEHSRSGTCQRIYTSERGSGGGARRIRANATASVLKQRLSEKHKTAMKRASAS